MADERTDADRETELRVKLMKRLAVAGGLVALLLGALAFFDYLAKPDEPEAPVFTKPVPVPPKKEVSQPVKPNADLPTPPAREDKPAETPIPAASVKTEEPAARPSSSPPDRPGAAISDASGKSARVAAKLPAEPTDRASRPVLGSATEQGVPESTAAPGAAVVAAPVRPAQEATPAQPGIAITPVPSATLPRLLRGYSVQAGLFANARAAEELHAKLALNGIPSTLEARVSVGPFKTREEAAVAQAKLKALGVEGLLLTPSARR